MQQHRINKKRTLLTAGIMFSVFFCTLHEQQVNMNDHGEKG